MIEKLLLQNQFRLVALLLILQGRTRWGRSEIIAMNSGQSHL